MNWLIIGTGLSGKSLANYFYSKQQKHCFYDDKAPSIETKKELTRTNSPLLKKEEALSLLQKKEASLILSPGIKQDHFLVREAKKHGCFITNEADFTLNRIETKVIAITGTNGKSTVATMCYSILKRLNLFSVELAGNIGEPISGLLTTNKKIDFLVLELSSYQLEQMIYKKFFCSLFTNFAEDHLERHKTLEIYFRTKLKIFKTEKPETSCGFWTQAVEEVSLKFPFSRTDCMPIKTIDPESLSEEIPENLRWPKHNKINGALALKACEFITKKTIKELAATLKSFTNIEHRFQVVGKTQKAIFIDDSKATNIDASESALSSVDKPTLLLLGGLSKGSDFYSLLKHKKKLTQIVAFGQASEEIEKSLQGEVPITKYKSLAKALKSIKSHYNSSQASYILLSPGCSSFDEFKNFSERGRFFKKIILSTFKKEFV